MIDAPQVRIQLRKDEHFTLGGARGARLSCVSGTAWITVDRDAEDVVIGAGESFLVSSDRLVLVGALLGAVTLDLRGIRPMVTAAHPCRSDVLAKLMQ